MSASNNNEVGMLKLKINCSLLNKLAQTCRTTKHQLHFGNQLHNKITDFHEVTIPVPWGHISGKWWGKENVQPVLALHGVQDNAATFDRLVPLLELDAVLALDVPGHGRSSHAPQGFAYDFMDAVSLIRFIIHHHYQWKDPVTLLGHSFGSFLSFVYSAVYPDQVSKYISLDCSRHHMAVTPEDTIPHMRDNIEKTLSAEGKTPPGYTYQELLERLYEGRKRRLTKESCEILLSRGMTQLDNGKVCFSRDIRTKLNAFGRPTPDELLYYASKIECSVLSVEAETGVVNNHIKGDLYRKSVDLILKKSTSNKHITLPGNHHFHLDHPEALACEVNTFLKG